MSTLGRGESKTLSTASNGQQSRKKDKKHNTPVESNMISNTSIDLDVSFDKPAGSVKELQQMFQQKLIDIQADFQQKLTITQADFQGRVDTLYNIVKMKEETIGRLQADIGALKESYNFMSKQTSENSNLITECSKTMETKLADASKYIQTVKDKTVDLEDRSRRSNLVFFNFPECENGQTENCEALIHDVLRKVNMLQDEEVWIDRAHRLGRKKPDLHKPRPIIVKFSYYKHKEYIIKHASQFRNIPINVSEDFSKETLDIHRKLISHGKHAKNSYNDSTKSILNYKLNYRRLLVTYSMNKVDPYAKKVTRSFTLGDISDNVHWFMLKPSGQGYHVNE